MVKRLAAEALSSSSDQSSAEESGSTGVVVGAAEVGGAEEAAGSDTMRVDSVKGADVTRTESDDEGRTTVG